MSFELRQDLKAKGHFQGYDSGSLPALMIGRKALARKKFSSAKGGANGKMKLVSYCPECPIPSQVHPESAPHIVVASGTKYGSCKAGHSWEIV